MRCIVVYPEDSGVPAKVYTPQARPGSGEPEVRGIFDTPLESAQVQFLDANFSARVPVGHVLHVEVDDISWYYKGWLCIEPLKNDNEVEKNLE